jgi:hypothetical protein
MTVLDIAHGANGLYAANTMANKADVTKAERETLRGRVNAGEWLRVGDVAKVLGIGRTKAHTLMTKGTIGYRLEPGSTYRVANPADLLKLLTESEQERRPSTPSSVMPTASPRKTTDL